jgi:hypothetical protein
VLTSTLALRSLLDACAVNDRAAAQTALVELVGALVTGPLPQVELGWDVTIADTGIRRCKYTLVSDSAVKPIDG